MSLSSMFTQVQKFVRSNSATLSAVKRSKGLPKMVLVNHTV